MTVKSWRTATAAEVFEQLVAAGENKTSAYIISFAPKNEQNAGKCAHRLAKRVDICTRIYEIQAETRESAFARSRALAERYKLSKEFILTSLREVADRCMTVVPVLDRTGNATGVFKFDAAGANRALELLGREIGMFVDKSEIGRPGEFARLAAMTEEELDAEGAYAPRVREQERGAAAGGL